ncbi:bifunctional diguanylate cyclase/phosphodiesterase [Tissierella sp. Yu-01]|uniref:GGDEF domain-containing protein n=1 Tax=Tissierella sp. Yu-01 TaxID=3035694 RepID=UPI00240CEF33|nr:bifunctional diguanylate cyclase/phosphodiesterase [Tissierella sp. Yu-01]WFA08355.1 EAL and GGDEF domain-containing protein [Tissierella sp. Yu-01]
MDQNLLRDLDYIIQNKKIKAVFQPIISLRNGSVLGHEALSRITHKCSINNPEILFNVAGEYNRLWELELLCRTVALEEAFKYMVPPYNKKLFINVNPNTMHDEKFKKGFTKEFLSKYNITPNNVIFEITERNVIMDMYGFRATVDHYKGQDYKIAIDDAGAGYSGLNLISDISPNYIKLDMNLIRDVDKDSLKYALIRGMVELSKVSNIYLIAEGIETYEELSTLINLGVQYGQGYYIQKPDEKILEIKKDIVNEIKDLSFMRNIISQPNIISTSIKNICTATPTINNDMLITDVYEIFKRNIECFGLCILDNELPVGIITRESLSSKLSGQYGFALHQNKPISHIMDENFLSVDYKTCISTVSTMAMDRSYDKLYDFIVVTENEKYLGTVTIKDLLEKTSEIKITMAKHLSPLSGLPGNVLIEQKLMECIENYLNYTIVYIDLDNFKAYNDVYGFENGDIILKLMADTLRNEIPEGQFVGHIGGDDFIVILDTIVNDDYFNRIVDIFESEVLNLYDEDDLDRGYILTNNRQGKLEKFPLLSATVVTINNSTKKYNSIYQLTKHLSRLKSHKKSIKKSISSIK